MAPDPARAQGPAPEPSGSDAAAPPTPETPAALPAEPDAVAGLTSGMQWTAWAVAALGSAIPGASFFTTYAPPAFEAVGLLTGGVALAVLVFAYTHRRHAPVTPLRPLACVLAALALVVSYGIARQWLTVAPPAERSGPPVQIGFHLAPWSLTQDAQTLIQQARGTPMQDLVNSPQNLMLAMGGFDGPSAVRTIWRGWSVDLAATVLIVLFISGFLLWRHGFGLLARFLAPQKHAQK